MYDRRSLVLTRRTKLHSSNKGQQLGLIAVFLAETALQLEVDKQELIAAYRLGLASARLFGTRALGSLHRRKLQGWLFAST
jgi:hypothetical protein